jgi:2-haloacid dehalogenase
MSALARLSPPPTVVAFDVYGTLLDVHSAVQRLAPQIGPDAARFSALWRTKQLEYTWVRSLAGRYRAFWHLTEEALDFAFASFPLIDRSLRPALLDAYRILSAYPEAADTLRRLRRDGLSLCVLSNGGPEMLAEALSAAGLADLVDAVLSVQDAGIFKTAPEVYQLACDRFGVTAGQAVLVSSNRWDIAGACAFGMRGVWVNRSAMPDEYADLAPAAVIASLAGL